MRENAGQALFDLQVPIRVVLRGELGERFGREWKLAVHNAAEAVRAIDSQRNGAFSLFLAHAHERGVGFSVLIDGQDIFHESAAAANDIVNAEADKDAVLKGLLAAREGMNHPIGNGTLEIVPQVRGGGDNPWLMVIIGVVLIVLSVAVAILFPALFPALVPAWGGVMGDVLGTTAYIGLMLAVSGAVSLIAGGGSVSATPNGLANARDDQSSGEEFDEQSSKNFSGPVNTTGTGEALPIICGRLIVGSHLGSFGIHTEVTND